jgi:ribosome-binding factor A
MISLVDIDVSPDLRNARVKFSVLGDRQDKVTATRWVLGNAGGIRMALAGRLRQMKRVPALNFQHVDVGKAVDVMVLLDQLSNERLGGGGGGGGTGDDLDFEASDDDAFGDGEGEAELTGSADEAAVGLATTASEDELFDGEDEDDGDDFDLAEFGLAGER